MFSSPKFLLYFIVTTLLFYGCVEEVDDVDTEIETPEPILTVTNAKNEDLRSSEIIIPFNPPGNDPISVSFSLEAENVTSDIQISATNDFQLSLNDSDFSSSIHLSSTIANGAHTLYARFDPEATTSRLISGVIDISVGETNVRFTISRKIAIGKVINYQTFDKERVAFGGGFTQTSRKTFTLHNYMENIESIKMYIQLTCPQGGCDEWDVFANVKINDPISGEDYELGRFITPYWNDNSQLPRGFEFDVTDFKSLLQEEVELRIRTECWNARGYEVSVDFDYIQGTPDYPYYAITRVLNYDNGSAAGVPYGKPHELDITREIVIPEQAESTHLRTFINGWGHAEPADSDGRRCAEWCYRTHHIKIDGMEMFDHYLGPLGCASNPVNNQEPGNWKPDRAGWCPGMEIPTRIDQFSNAMAGQTIAFEYAFEEWEVEAGQEAYYPVSTFVVVKSNTEIERAMVID